MRLFLTLWLTLVTQIALAGSIEDDDFFLEDDLPLEEAIQHPAWFKLSFLNLGDDLSEATKGDKLLMVYFGQRHCSYCQALLEGNYSKLDILAYTKEQFDTVGIDIHGDHAVKDFSGKTWTERSFAAEHKVDFTPTLIFYDKDQNEALRLPGFYPPYKYRAALEFVAGEHYKKETFRDYLSRGEVGMVFDEGALNDEPYFSPPPYALDRSRMASDRPLVVFFEQNQCHACDILHTGPLRKETIQTQFADMDVVQLNMWNDTPVITPAGVRTTAKQWARDLDLFYTPTLIFFDERGEEIIRVNSVVQFYRLQNVLSYILTDAYQQFPTFQAWRSSQ